MTHKFEPKDYVKLENPERYKKLPPKEILYEKGLNSGNYFLDVGAGTGYFSFPASEIVGENGKVFATDISKEMLEELERRIVEKGVTNIQTINTKENEVGVNHQIIDFALICFVFHEFYEKSEFLKKISAVVKENGTICIIDWAKKETVNGPPIDHRVSIDEAVLALQSIGLKKITLEEKGDSYYIVLGKK